MSSSYDYRMRQPSKEVAGTWPFMRTRPRSESARINEEVTHSTPVDGHAGGNWTLDPKYGNPASRSAQSIGNTFRAQSPRRWITATSPESKGKWRGSFVTSFPPSHAGHSSQPMGDAKPRWLLHEEPYIEQCAAPFVYVWLRPSCLFVYIEARLNVIHLAQLVDEHAITRCTFAGTQVS